MTDTVPSAPRRRSLLEGFNGGMQSMGMWYEKVFEKYGEKVYDYSLIILGVFMALYVGLAFGLLVAEEEVDIDELWVEEGTRLRDERDEFNKRWGGISHLEIVAITKNNGGYVSTREGVKAMILALTPMLRVVEAGNNDTPGIQVGITNKDEITLTYTFDGKTRTMQEKNICESPTASSLFGPGIAYPGELATNTAAWAGGPHIVQAMTEWTNLMISSANAADDMFSGVTSVQANSALVNSSCPLRNGLRSLWLKDGLPDATSTVPARQQGTNYLRIDIPDAGYTSSYNFSVDRFPCIRGGPADCFQEGNFDYPYGLKRMEGLGYTMSVLASFGAALLQAPFSYVSSDVTNVTKFVIADAGFAANAAWAPTKGLFSQLVNANVAALGRPDCTGAWANVGPAVANMAFRLVLGASSFKTTVNTTMNALVAGNFTTQSTADSIIGLYEFSTDGSAFLFWAGTGYAWRKSLQSTTDFPLNTDIDDHIVASSANTDNSSYTSTACIQTGKCCPYWSQTRVSSGTFVGTKFTDGGVYDGRIKALRTVINHFSPGHPIWINRMNALFGVNTTAGDRSFDKDSLLKVADAYEQKFIDYLTPIWEQKSSPYKDDFADYKIDFLMWRSATDVVREGGKIESGLIIIGYTILIIYACFSLARTDGCANFMVYSRSLVVVWGVFTVALATLTGFGVTALIGWKLTPISIQLVPFLALGIGVDDMFVIAHTTVYHAHLKDPRERIVKSMSIAGPSVLLTSVTNATAFFLAVFTPIPAVSTFVLQMGMTAILTIIALLTIFVPILVWDSKRVAARNPELCFSCCKPDQVPEEAGDGERKGFINKCTKGWFVPLMKSLPGKIVTLVFFTTLFIVLTYLAFTNNETGLRLSDITLAGTYQRDYAELQENNFPGYNNYMITMGKNQPYQGSVSTCDSKDCKLFVIFELIDKMQASPYLAAGFNISDFNWPTSLNSAVTGNDYTNVPANLWNTAFQGWITTSGATSQLDMYCEDGSGNLIQCPQFDAGQGNIVEATKMTIFNDNLIEHERFLDTIRDARDRMDSVDPKDSFIFGWMYQYWEQYLTIEENLYTVMGLSLAGVLGAIIIFQCDLISSLIVTIFILIIDLEVYGAISFMDVKINAFSVVNLVMTVGMAVEFTAHISHVFLLAQGNRNQRMGVALEEMMAPMLSGFLSSFLAVIPLAFAKFPFFRAYYFGMFAAMIILAFGNGMIFMPVVLSLIGPGARAPAGGGFYKPTHSTNVQMSTANEI